MSDPQQQSSRKNIHFEQFLSTIAEFRNLISQRYYLINKTLASIEVSQKNNKEFIPNILQISDESWLELCNNDEEKTQIESELKKIKELHDISLINTEQAEHEIEKYRETTHTMEDILIEFTDSVSNMKTGENFVECLNLFVEKMNTIQETEKK